MIVRTALQSRKNCLVDRLGEFAAAHDHRAARSAQSLVGGGRNHVGIRNGIGMHSADNQAGDVRDVGKVQRADFLGYFAEGAEIPEAWIRGPAGDDYLRTFLARHRADYVEVDDLALAIDHVLRRAPELPGDADLPAVGEMAPMRERESH